MSYILREFSRKSAGAGADGAGSSVHSGRSRREVLGAIASATAALGMLSHAKLAQAALPAHPRLYLNAAAFAALPTVAQSSAFATNWAKQIISRAKYKYSLPPVTAADFSTADTVFTIAGEVSSRAQLYGIANALKPDPNLVARAIQECMTCCALATWYPSKFIGVAAMAEYVALVYDWFYASLTPTQISTIRSAIRKKAFVPYEQQLALSPQPFWVLEGATNWNIVCNAGIGIAALTFYGTIINSAKILKQTLANIKLGFAYFGPDGGWFEGPAYWALSVTHAVNFLAALDSAGMSSGTLAASPGFSNTGAFVNHITGPTGKVFNFGDSDDTDPRVPQLEWLARQFADPLQSYSEIESQNYIEGMNLGWFAANLAPPPTPPLDAVFTGVGLATFRSAFGVRTATWLAIKGGTNGLRHGNLDLGTFVFDSRGQRFAMELGADSYSLPGYFNYSGPRYQYYRTGSPGHNVLVSGGANQVINASASILSYHTAQSFSRVVFDLSSAYPGLNQKRGGGLIASKHAVISDEVTPTTSTQLRWQMHTQALISITNNVAKLRLNGVVLYAHILQPATGAVFLVASAAAPAPQNPNTGIRKLIVNWTVPAGKQRLVVVLSPLAQLTSAIVKTALIPLERW